MRLTEGERDLFRKLPPVRVSEWAACYLIVPDGPYAGARYRRDVNPYLIGIMDAWGTPGIEEALVCGAPQTGKTLALDACLAYSIERRKGSRMLTMPDDDTVARVVEAKLRPLLQKTAPTRRLLRKIRSGRIAFSDGTSLFLPSAASPSQRASISVMDLFMDEEALYRLLAGQGDPVTDFRERTRSYAHKRKILRISKPVGDESTSIWRDLQRMDEVRDYHVVCPACNKSQPMLEENVVTEHNVKDPERVERERLGRYRCRDCKWHWTDYVRDQAVALGHWEARHSVPDARRVGFYLPAILSGAVSLSEIAAAKLRAEATDDPAVIQAYDNGIWARPYRPVVVHTAEDVVLSLRDAELPPRVLPAGYVALTAGIDMQKRGFYFLVCAWTPRMDCAVVDYGRLKDWDDVAALCFETTYPVQDGGDGERTGLWRAALDTGGGLSEPDGDLTRGEEAYAFVSRYGADLLHAVKGNAHKQLNPVQWTVREKMPHSRTPIRGGLRLYLLDPDYLKRLATGRMSPDARQPLRLHRDCAEDLARQMTAEELVREASGRTRWRRKRRDNHFLDCLCMAMACAHQTWTPSLARLVEGLTAVAGFSGPEYAPEPSERHRAPDEARRMW